MSRQKVGILGGAFNPVHIGHLRIAETALSQFGLDQILWIPTYSPSHKQTGELANFQHRLNMVQCAIAHQPYSAIPAMQTDPEGFSYAIATLLQLQELFASADWYWILGIDAFQTLPQWRSSAQVAAQCSWLVAPRYPLDALQVCHQVAAQFKAEGVRINWQVLSMPQLVVSSSLIRSYCRMGRSLCCLVPNSVRDYIAAHQLYQI